MRHHHPALLSFVLPLLLVLGACSSDGDRTAQLTRPELMEPIEPVSVDTETYCDSNGGEWDLSGEIGGNSGTYERRDADGNVTDSGTWGMNFGGTIAYESTSGSAWGTITPRRDGTCSYEGWDNDDNYEEGSLTTCE
jgi:hypothetical protein